MSEIPDEAAKIGAKVQERFSKFPKRTYPKGQILVFADEDPEHIYYIVSGRVREYDVSYRGDEIIVNVFKEHAFFPMSWALTQANNRFFFKAETAVELHIVPVAEALDFLKQNPDVTLDLLTRVYLGMEGLLGRMVHLMSGSAKSRLIYELIVDARRFGEQLQGGSILLSSSESDIAARSGLTRETVSREMRKLKSSGAVQIDRSSIIIADIKALQELLGQEA